MYENDSEAKMLPHVCWLLVNWMRQLGHHTNSVKWVNISNTNALSIIPNIRQK